VDTHLIGKQCSLSEDGYQNTGVHHTLPENHGAH
jgi:hypothetical protein